MKKSIIIALVLGLCGALSSGCAATKKEQLPFLAEQYSPNHTPATHARPDGLAPFERRGEVRVHRVSAPNGKVYALRWRRLSESVGSPAAGTLHNGSPLPKNGVGFKVVGSHTYGTDETNTYLQYAAWLVDALYPGTAPIVIGHVSRIGGGHLDPHISHQSGRDADVGLYRTGNKALRHFKSLKPEQLDVEKTWVFIEALIRTGRVHKIFLDRRIQEQLFEFTLNEGWSRATLQRIFQYPEGSRRAIIRHIKGHRNHMHVRFKCPREDSECQT